MDQHHLRNRIRQQRRALSAEARASAAQKLNQHLQALDLVQQAERIGLYIVNDGEIDPAEFLSWAWEQAKLCYLPIVRGNDESMLFALVTPDSRFTRNRFNIPEPVVDQEQVLQAHLLDLILMPLVAFDAKGNRLGMGGGFYDRTLAFKHQRPYHQRPTLIGLAHEFQRVDQIVPAIWDISLQGVVTDKRARLFEQR